MAIDETLIAKCFFYASAGYFAFYGAWKLGRNLWIALRWETSRGTVVDLREDQSWLNEEERWIPTVQFTDENGKPHRFDGSSSPWQRDAQMGCVVPIYYPAGAPELAVCYARFERWRGPLFALASGSILLSFIPLCSELNP